MGLHMIMIMIITMITYYFIFRAHLQFKIKRILIYPIFKLTDLSYE